MSRRATVASLVPPGSRVAEIGAGDARLALALLRFAGAAHCIGIDRSSAALEQARAMPAVRAELSGRLELRRGDGLRVLRPEDRVQVLVVAGLGARSVVSIVASGDPAALGVRTLVAQPQSEPALLRRWLVERGLLLSREAVARERGRHYFVMRAELAGGPTDLSHPVLDAEAMLEAGPLLVRARDPLALELWQARERGLRGAMARSKEPRARERLERRLARARAIVSALGDSGRLL